jgi:iron(III) transport system substrate-binding protein
LLRVVGLSGVAALAAACSQSSPPPPATQQAPAQGKPAPAEFDSIVAAAKKEGRVIVATYAGSAYRKALDDFEAAYPGIKVEQTGFQSSSRDFFPRYFQERQAGLYQWDLIIVPATEVLVQAVPQGAVDPVRPLIVRPDALDDRSWIDGFEGGWLDKRKQYSYGITSSRSQSLWINTEQIREGEVKGYKDLLDPKWKGKILAADLRTKGSGFWPGTALRLKTGNDDLIKQLWKDQDAVLSTDARQLTEFMVRGVYPVSVGAISKTILLDFLAQGQGKQLKAIPSVELDYLNSSNHVLHYANKAPNPNAAKVLVNWLLSKDGSASYSKNVQDNARRADVAPFDPEIVAEKGVDYVKIDAEENVDEILKTQKIAASVIG